MTAMKLITFLAFSSWLIVLARLSDASSDNSVATVDSDFYKMKDRCTSIALGNCISIAFLSSEILFSMCNKFYIFRSQSHCRWQHVSVPVHRVPHITSLIPVICILN